MENIPKLFASLVFDDKVMRRRLPRGTYNALKKTIRDGKALDITIANVVANAMKDWAIEKGATHYTHWFQPMTGATAEKHDSFISPTGDGNIIMEFSGKELIKGEPDASSFPSGGLRATFEARGYTAWDPTSYAFIKDHTLCIPTAFCSFGGEALDKKTPLLRSMEALNKQALRILKLFGHTDVHRVLTTVGAEQEYFLVDRDVWKQREDLVMTGRTLFGAKPPKGQQLEDHYFGVLKPRVSAFMKELDEELWKLGILSKTKHNEVAPGQHELAPVFTTTNIATDHNQLTMELMKKIANKHNLACLLHEKPFEWVNGSGKHNNWSVCTDTGINLLEPGKSPHENAQFLLFLTAVLKAVDQYQDLIRISAASAGNDCRLGGHEAPPAIVSVFLGDELTAILDSIADGTDYNKQKKQTMEIGVAVLPHFPKDSTDRNRTSPFAFTGNKFEFRMLGSSFSIACANIMLNTAVADVLGEFADELEGAPDFTKALSALVKRTITEHRRIVFNGNNYEQAWVDEAAKRGLLNLATTPEALDTFTDDKNIALFARQNVYNKTEVVSRTDILFESYCKVVRIEAHTMLHMARKEILPASIGYTKFLTDSIVSKQAAIPGINCAAEQKVAMQMSDLVANLSDAIEALQQQVDAIDKTQSSQQMAHAYCDKVIPAMQALRKVADTIETVSGSEYDPFPNYIDLLFSVN